MAVGLPDTGASEAGAPLTGPTVGESVSGEALTGAPVGATPDVGELDTSVGLLRATTGELTGAFVGASVGVPKTVG